MNLIFLLGLAEILLLVVCFVIVWRVLAKSRQTECALIEAQKRYTSIFENKHVSMLLIDPSTGALVDANQAACQFYGYSREEMRTKNITDLNMLPPDEVVRQMEKAKKEQIKVFNFPHRLATGEIRYVEVFSGPIEIQGRLLLFSIIHDVTERKNAEEERLQLQRQQLETLKQADRLKDEFLALISHELRTPLNAVMGFGSILDDEVLGPLNLRQHDSLHKILKGAEKMLDLVTDLLDVARMTAGKFEIQPTKTFYPAVVEDVLLLLAPLAERKRIMLRSDVQAPIEVSIDRQAISRVLSNLISNAIKFTREGGEILVKSYIDGNSLVTEVKDNGLGIASEDIPRLFLPFTQFHEGAKRLGTGLGLTISKGIVEAHHGTIKATSPGKGKGSVFCFTLPL